MSHFSPNFEFADDAPIQKGRRHRRSRGYNTPNKSGFSANSFKSHSSAASSSLVGPMPSSIRGNELPQTQHFTADWDSNANAYTKNNEDHNSCTGSLTYSASSSVQSGMSSGGESSNDSSFADIIKLIDSEGDGASEIKAFIAARSEAAVEDHHGREGGGGAVAGWMQRVDARSKQHQQQKKQQQLMQKAMAASGRQPRPKENLTFNARRDDSDGHNAPDNILETISVRDEDVVRRHNITVTTRSQPSASLDNHRPLYSATNPSRQGSVTPPPNNRNNKRTSGVSDFASAPTIQRTNSHRSKSSSDGSWDTPTASPTHSNRPPHARSTPVIKTSSRRKGEGGKDSSVRNVGDFSEAVYTKFWMCGFTDSFNFDSLKKP